MRRSTARHDFSLGADGAIAGLVGRVVRSKFDRGACGSRQRSAATVRRNPVMPHERGVDDVAPSDAGRAERGVPYKAVAGSWGEVRFDAVNHVARVRP
jgi:hypothetical protein